MARNLTLINGETLAAAGTYTGDPIFLAPGTKALALQVKFVRAGGGTTTKVYLQTTFDDGATWVDIACLAFATTTSTKVSGLKTDIAVTPNTSPTDATMTDNTVLDGLLGDRIRAKYVVAGTYTGASSVTVSAVAN